MKFSFVNLITQVLVYFAVRYTGLYLGLGDLGSWFTALIVVLVFCPPILIVEETAKSE